MLTKHAELRHIADGARAGEQAGGAGTVDVVGELAGHPSAVLARCREVALAALAPIGEEPPELEAWCAVVPTWFREACAPRLTRAQSQEWLANWRRLDRQARVRAEWEKGYDLHGWLYWLEPARRERRWWDARAEVDAVVITVEVPGWPTALGAVEWLLRAAGARETEVRI